MIICELILQCIRQMLGQNQDQSLWFDTNSKLLSSVKGYYILNLLNIRYLGIFWKKHSNFDAIFLFLWKIYIRSDRQLNKSRKALMDSLPCKPPGKPKNSFLNKLILTHQGNQIWKRHVHPNVHRSTLYHSQDMEAT